MLDGMAIGALEALVQVVPPDLVLGHQSRSVVEDQLRLASGADGCVRLTGGVHLGRGGTHSVVNRVVDERALAHIGHSDYGDVQRSLFLPRISGIHWRWPWGWSHCIIGLGGSGQAAHVDNQYIVGFCAIQQL